MQFAFAYDDGSSERFDVKVHTTSTPEKVNWEYLCGNPRSRLQTYTSYDGLRIARIAPDGVLVEDRWQPPAL